MKTISMINPAASQCEIEVGNSFSETKGIGKRNFSIIMNEAIKIAEMLNASAIITFSEEFSQIPTRIPLFTFSGRKSTMINELTRHIDEADRNI